MKKIADVLVTRDYNLFTFLRGNRAIDAPNLEKIKESMKEEQLLIPIIVNQNMQIIDGQHRFTAAKELGLPIYYIVNEAYGLEQVLRCNTGGSKKWTNEDFLFQHCEMNNDNYIQFRDLCQRYNVSVSDMIKIFCKTYGENTSIFKQNFRSGAFVMDDKQKICDFLNGLDDFNIGDFYRYNKKSNFIAAFMKLYFRKDYDHEIMKTKLETNGYQLKKCATTNDYLAMLCNNIYSYNSKKNTIFFSAETGNFFTK